MVTVNFGGSYQPVINPYLKFIEHRIQTPISYTDPNEVYHHFLYDRYVRPSAGWSGKYCLKDFLDFYNDIIITLNMRNDSGSKSSWLLRPIEEFVNVAKTFTRLKKDFPNKNIAFNFGNETFYRYGMNANQILPYIIAIKPIINNAGFKLGGVGDEFITLDQREGIVKLKPYLDFISIHFLYTPLSEIEYIYNLVGKLCVLETGTQTKDYRNLSGYNYIKYLLDGYIANYEKVSHVAFIYCDSNYQGDASYVMRLWNSNYSNIIGITKTWELYQNYIERYGEKMEYNRLPELQAIVDALGIGTTPYQWALPWLSMFYAGEKDPSVSVKHADLDALFEKCARSGLLHLPAGLVLPCIKYKIDGTWNSGWEKIAKSNPKE